MHIVDFLAFALKQEYFVFGAAIFEAAFLKVSEQNTIPVFFLKL